MDLREIEKLARNANMLKVERDECMTDSKELENPPFGENIDVTIKINFTDNAEYDIAVQGLSFKWTQKVIRLFLLELAHAYDIQIDELKKQIKEQVNDEGTRPCDTDVGSDS